MSRLKKFIALPEIPVCCEAELKTVPIKELNFEKLVDFARKQAINLTVVGPELPLQQGIVDYFNAAGLTIFGPSQAAAKLESSKQFAKKVMQEVGVPTARYASFQDEALQSSVIQDNLSISN